MSYFEKTNIADQAGVIINPATEESAADSASLLRRILNALLAPLGYDKSIQRYRQTAVVESGTITTVTGIANLGTYQATQQVYGQNLTAWNACVRSRIT
jgi:hypothetical protein